MDKATKHTFALYEHHTWSKYPDELKERYKEYLYTDITDGKYGEIFVTEELCSEILKHDINFLGLERNLRESFERRRTRAVEAYVQFIEGQAKDPTVTVMGNWPDFNIPNYDNTFEPPSDSKLRVVFMRCFELVLPFLKRDLYSRTPGCCIKWDATFNYAKVTMDDPDSSEEIKALSIMFGQYGHVMNWAFSGSESDLVYQRLNYFLLERCKIHGQDHVDKVAFGYSDICCGGCKDRKQHWFTSAWPNVSEAPYKDLMHGQKKLFDSTRGADHELHTKFTGLVRTSCSKYDAEGCKRVFKQFQKDSKGVNYTPQVGIPVMLRQHKYTSKICNYIPDKTTLETELEAAYSTITEEEEVLAAEAAANGEGYLTYFLRPVTGKRRGTRSELDNMIRHIRKGCYKDPLPPDQMSVPLDPDDMVSDLIRLRSTSQGEAFNKQAGRLVYDVPGKLQR